MWIKAMKCLLCVVCALIYSFSSINGEELIHDCPEPLDIYPCYCEMDEGEPWVICNHLTTAQQLYQGVKGLKKHKIYKLSFFKNWILEPIKSDAFNAVTAEIIQFETSTVNLESPQFQGINQIVTFQMSACFNKTNILGTWDLGHLSGLREIILDKNRIRNLSNDWLKSVPDSLRTVTIEGNGLVSLGGEVFAKVKQLTFLGLEDNRITTLKRSMFPKPAQALRTLNLNGNSLRFLPDDLFTDMPNLRSVELDNNRITTLYEKIWSNIFPQLTKLYLQGNPLVCDKGIKWLFNGMKLPSLFVGFCEEPEKLKGKPLRKLKAHQLD